MENNEVLNKIKKLLSLANDKAAFDGEVDGALRAVRNLMLKHNIEQADVDAHDPSKAQQTKFARRQTDSLGKDLSTWEAYLMVAICELIGTIKCYRTYNKTAEGFTVIYFYGPEQDTETAKQMFIEWTEIIATMARMKFKTVFRGDGRSYAEGFAVGLQTKVKKIRDADNLIGEYRGALVLMENKKEQAAQWFAKEFSTNLVIRKKVHNKQNVNAWLNGKQDGLNSEFKINENKSLKIGGNQK